MPMKAALFWALLGPGSLPSTPFWENVTSLAPPCSGRPFWVGWGMRRAVGEGGRGSQGLPSVFLGSQTLFDYKTWSLLSPGGRREPGSPSPHSTGYFQSRSWTLSCFHPSLPQCYPACVHSEPSVVLLAPSLPPAPGGHGHLPARCCGPQGCPRGRWPRSCSAERWADCRSHPGR